MPKELSKVGDDTTEVEFYGELDFDTLIQEGAYVSDGADLVSGEGNEELYAKLVGVPFGITKFEFREGTPYVGPSGETYPGDYVTVSAQMANEKTMRNRQVDMGALPAQLYPGNRIVFNDGSTGIRRESVKFLNRNRFITLPQPIVEGGAKGESTYDLVVDGWVEINHGYVAARDGGLDYTVILPKPFLLPRGLRYSEYPNPINPKQTSRTYYFG